MSHIHLPDGVIPVFWWVAGYIVMIAMLSFSLWMTKRVDVRKKVPLLGIIAALMLIGMSIPLGIIPYHINFAILAGMLLGPWLGFIAAFVVNLFLALIGHGGITVLGLNTLTVGSEAVFGAFLFRLFRRLTGRIPVAAFIATMFALLISVSLMIGIVAVSRTSPTFLVREYKENSANVPAPKTASTISLRRFVYIVVPLAIPGILIESTMMALMTGFIIKTRPDMLERRK